MRTNEITFWILGVFFLLVAGVYTWWSWDQSSQLGITTAQGVGSGGLATSGPEWAGVVTLTLLAALGFFLAFYLRLVHKAQGGELAEDRLDANIDDGDPEIGHFAPWSWWPIALAGGASLILLGFAVGIWIIPIGAAITIVSLVGWVYEHYRGNFSH